MGIEFQYVDAAERRATEVVVFGGSAVFFLLLSVWILQRSAARGYLIPVTQIWTIQIFMYALFIPNTLRRAIAIIGTMAATPVVLMVGLLFTSADMASVIRLDPGRIAAGIVTGIGFIGAGTIIHLRNTTHGLTTDRPSSLV